MYLVFDTETTGLPIWKEPSDHPDQPHVVDIAWTLFDRDRNEIERFDAIINNVGVTIPDDMAALHGITTERAAAEGIPPADMWERFVEAMLRAEIVVGHNISFDVRMMRITAARLTGDKWDNPHPTFCTMRKSTNLCRIPSAKQRHPEDWKWPRLTEAAKHFFGEELPDAHRARPDCDASARIFFHLKDLESAK